jgi:hypothetical protein
MRTTGARRLPGHPSSAVVDPCCRRDAGPAVHARQLGRPRVCAGGHGRPHVGGGQAAGSAAVRGHAGDIGPGAAAGVCCCPHWANEAHAAPSSSAFNGLLCSLGLCAARRLAIPLAAVAEPEGMIPRHHRAQSPDERFQGPGSEFLRFSGLRLHDLMTLSSRCC